ncbi:MAG: hypothetical protein DRP42_05720, partial [Tenericutes bacterium]
RVGEVTVKQEFGGILVTAKSRLSYVLDQATLSALIPELTDEEREAIDYKPTLKISAYKKLGPKSLLHEAVESRNAAPTISIEEK